MLNSENYKSSFSMSIKTGSSYFLVIFFQILCCGFVAFAQYVPKKRTHLKDYPANEVRYLKSYLTEADTPSEAAFFGIYQKNDVGGISGSCQIFRLDSTLIENTTFENGLREGVSYKYYPNQTLKAKGIYKADKAIGIWEYWFENGQKQEELDFDLSNIQDNIDIDAFCQPALMLNAWNEQGIQIIENGNGVYVANKEPNYFEFFPYEAVLKGRFVDGLKEGEWIAVDTESKIVYREIHKAGILMEGISYDSLGNSYSYLFPETSAEPVSGMKDFYQEISQKMKFTTSMRKAKIQGTVILSIVIGKEGNFEDLEVIRSLHPEADKAAIEVFSQLTPWLPAKIRGKPTKQRFSLPIAFR